MGRPFVSVSNLLLLHHPVRSLWAAIHPNDLGEGSFPPPPRPFIQSSHYGMSCHQMGLTDVSGSVQCLRPAQRIAWPGFLFVSAPLFLTFIQLFHHGMSSHQTRRQQPHWSFSDHSWEEWHVRSAPLWFEIFFEISLNMPFFWMEIFTNIWENPAMTLGRRTGNQFLAIGFSHCLRKSSSWWTTFTSLLDKNVHL